MGVKAPVVELIVYMDTLPTKTSAKPKSATYANFPVGSTAIDRGNTPPAAMRKVKGFELAPPGGGLKTVTAGGPVAATRLARSCGSAVLATRTGVCRSPASHLYARLAHNVQPQSDRS